MKKKIMAVTLCLAMVSTFAVGCGQKNETDSGKSEEKSSGKVEIEFVQVKREAAESYTKVIEAFEKETPNTVTYEKGHGRIEKREYRLLTDIT